MKDEYLKRIAESLDTIKITLIAIEVGVFLLLFQGCW